MPATTALSGEPNTVPREKRAFVLFRDLLATQRSLVKIVLQGGRLPPRPALKFAT